MAKRGYGSGSLRERRPGVWELRAGGRTKTVRGGRKDAERALAQLVTVAAARGPVATGVTLDRLLTEWLSSASHLRESTVVSYTAALAHVSAQLRSTRLDRLQLRTFDDLYAQLDRDGVGRQQIRKLHTALSSALTEAVRWRWIDHHPARGARVPTIPKRQVTMPQDDAITKLLATAKPDQQTSVWLRLALATGARRGEVLALRWSNINLANASIEFTGSMNEDRTVTSTKTDDERGFALDAGTVKALDGWRRAQIERALATGVRMVRDPFVLSNALDGSVPWRPDGATQRFRRLAARAGLAGVRLNDLRHANVSIQLRNGVPLHTVSYRVGHKRVSTTQDVYGHVLDGDDVAAANVIGRRLGS